MTGSGQLSEYLTIQSATETADSQGGAAVTWGTVANIWGQIVPLGANERSQAEAMGSVVSYRFRVRARGDVEPSMRVSWTPRWPPSQSAQTLEIHGVVMEPSRAYMLLECGVRS